MFQSNKSFLQVFHLLILLTVASFQGFSQKEKDSQTTVTVTVINASQNGAVVPGAQVLFISENVQIRGETNVEGKLHINLPRKIFTLNVTTYGFDTFERRKLRIRHLLLAIAVDLIPSEISSHDD